MEEARRGPSTETRRVSLINIKIYIKVISLKMDILRVTMGLYLLAESVCASVTRVLGLIPHIPLYSMIYRPPVC